MTALGKKNALDALLLLLQQGEIKCPEFSTLRKELRTYVRQDRNLRQDTVMALSIAALFAGRPQNTSVVIAGGDRFGLSVQQVVSHLAVLSGQRADPSRIARSIRANGIPNGHPFGDSEEAKYERRRLERDRKGLRMGRRLNGGEE
jgi:hypothetical protein